MEADECCVSARPQFEHQVEDDKKLASLCHALGHRHRVFILRFLAAQETCFVGEIADQLPIAASTVSQHLHHLKKAGLIKGEVDGPRRCYCIDPDVLDHFRRLVGDL